MEFQSTLRRTERRCFSWNFDIGVYDFNPRSDERSNLLLLLSSLRQTNFNPRSDERSDLPPSYRSPAHLISIHAPTNGATQRAFEREHTRTISIHAPTNGATEIQELKPQTIIFQSTLRRTERQTMLLRVVIFINFNPRSDERSDNYEGLPSSIDVISIHAPTNGATGRLFINMMISTFQSTLRRTERPGGRI